MSAFAAVTVREALDGAVTAITAAGVEGARLDAELLLAAALSSSREQLHMYPQAPVTGPAVRVFQDFVRRRSVGREPVAYILGRRGFRNIELLSDPRALIARPETELLVEVGLTLAPGARVLDVGTGSGAIALALAQERPDLELWASDVSEAALTLARENAAALGIEVSFFLSDLLVQARGRWDAVLSNPPYIAAGELAGLAPEITRHEPRLALDGGADGLDVVRRLIAQAQDVALLALELGAGQAATVAALCEGAFAEVEVHRDLAGIERVLVARR